MTASQLSPLGCASSLDFDHVASGRQPDAAVGAGSIEATMRTTTEASSAQAVPMDAGVVGPSQPDARAHAASLSTAAASSDDDAGSSDSDIALSTKTTPTSPAEAAVSTDPAAFSCAKVRPKPYFCDDFESLELRGHWSEVAVQPTDPLPGGTLEIDSNAARAGQSSLLAEVNEGLRACENCIQLRAGMSLPILQGPIKLTAELDVRVEQVDPNDGRRVTLFQLWWGTPETGFTQQTLQLWSSDKSAWAGLVELATEPQSTDDDVSRPTSAEHQWQQTPELSQWVHVVYTLDVQDALGTASMARLTLDNLVLFDGPLSYGLRETKGTFEIGVPAVDVQTFGTLDTSQTWRARYDNVLIRYEAR